MLCLPAASFLTMLEASLLQLFCVLIQRDFSSRMEFVSDILSSGWLFSPFVPDVWLLFRLLLCLLSYSFRWQESFIRMEFVSGILICISSAWYPICTSLFDMRVLFMLSLGLPGFWWASSLRVEFVSKSFPPRWLLSTPPPDMGFPFGLIFGLLGFSSCCPFCMLVPFVAFPLAGALPWGWGLFPKYS